MTEPDELARAEARAAAARERMTTTLGALQTRLAPHNVAHEAMERISDTSARALDAGVNAAKRHPGKIAGGVALLAAFLGRRHIGKLLGSLGEKRRTARAGRRKPARAVRVPSGRTPPRAERKEK